MNRRSVLLKPIEIIKGRVIWNRGVYCIRCRNLNICFKLVRAKALEKKVKFGKKLGRKKIFD